MKKIVFLCIMLSAAFAVSAQSNKYIEEGAKPKMKPTQIQKMTPEKKTAPDTENIPDLKTSSFEERIFTVAEVPARFPEEYGNLQDWIKANIIWPLDVPEDIEGTVNVRVVVEKDGKLTSPSILESLYPDFDTEALRIVGNMPAWIPAKLRNDFVRTYVIVPIVFEKNDKK